MDTLTIKTVHSEEIFRWIARIGSLASVGMLLFFGSGEEFHPAQLTALEWISLMFFPTGVTFGLVAAWRCEFLGGAIAVASLTGFYVMENILGHVIPLGWALGVLVVPGFLFLVAATMRRRGLE